MSEELDTPVSQANVSDWLKSREPREQKYLPQNQKAVLSAAERITLRTQLAASRAKHQVVKAAKTPAKARKSSTSETDVAAEDVAYQIREWLGQKVTPWLIQQMADIDEAAYNEWASGKTAVSAARWAPLHKKVCKLVRLLASRSDALE